jgi:hypothetical protein
MDHQTVEHRISGAESAQQNKTDTPAGFFTAKYAKHANKFKWQIDSPFSRIPRISRLSCSSFPCRLPALAQDQHSSNAEGRQSERESEGQS